MVDLKRVYRATSKDAAEQALDELEARRGDLYPIVIKSWRTKWITCRHTLSTHLISAG